MCLLQFKIAFDWRRMGVFEVLLRSAIMFIVAIIALRLIGKRGIMQGIFELVTIITLGSAAGDPMFYKKVGLLLAILVFVTIVLMYRITNYFVAKSKFFEHVIEGRHVRLVEDCRFVVENFNHEELSKDEIFSELLETEQEAIKETGMYSCGFCGYTEKISKTKKHNCSICNKTKWVKSLNEKRVK